jgi:DNA helicase HerA-like ATPase
MSLDNDTETVKEFALADLDADTKATALAAIKSMRRIKEIPLPLVTHLSYFGMTGTGKSRDALELAKRIHAQNLGHVYYLDWKFDVENIKDEERFLIPDQLSELNIEETEGQPCKFAVVYSDNDPDIMAHFCRTIFKAKRDGAFKKCVYLFMDEIDDYQYHGDNHPVLQIFRQGRGLHVHGIAITPRPQDCDKAIMDNCNDGLIFGRIKRAAVKRMLNNYDLDISPAVRVWWASRAIDVPDVRHPGGSKKVYPNKVIYDDTTDGWILIDEEGAD